MNQCEHAHLIAERAALRSMLERTPAEDVIDRMSLEARLEDVEAGIALGDAEIARPASARLTFGGRPVIGSHGVFAEFGAKAMEAFADTVAVLAAAHRGPLAERGPIPNRDQYQLLVTGTALGSFGFEVEERQQQRLSGFFEEETSIAVALRHTLELLEGVSGTDDELTEAVVGLSPRAVGAFRGFLEVLASNQAICTLQSGGRAASFRDAAAVRRALQRLDRQNVHEETQEFYGEFQGVLPKRRTFEFRVASDNQVIAGRIGTEMENPDELNGHLRQPVSIVVTATRLGNGRPRYVLHEMPAWHEVEPAV